MRKSHNFALGGSITPHWVAELIAFSSLMLCAPNLIPYIGFLFRCYSDPLKSFPNLSDPIEQERLSPAAVGAFVNIVKMWSLRMPRPWGCSLLSLPPRS